MGGGREGGGSLSRRGPRGRCGEREESHGKWNRLQAPIPLFPSLI